MNTLRRISLLLTLAIVLACPHVFFACSEAGEDPEYAASSRPHDLVGFGKGQLGVIRPHFWHIYLYGAYRALNGAPLNATEQASLKDLWAYGQAPREDDNATFKRWDDLHRSVANAPANDTIAQEVWLPDAYQAIRNCPAPAIRNAADTLEARIAKFGKDSAQVRDWLQAQDTVFSNCESDKGKMPEPAAGGSDPLIRADRAYQVAAAKFYSFQYDDAAKDFSAIAADKDSPWRDTARFVAARCLIRKATVFGIPDADKYRPAHPNPQILAQGREQLLAILADRHMAKYHAAAQQLLGFVDYRLRPDERSAELAAALGSPPTEPGEMAQELSDYVALLEHGHVAAGDEMGHWIMAWDVMRTDYWVPATPVGIAKLGDAADRYQRTRALPWLVLLLSGVRADDPGVDALIHDATAVPPSSPAYVALRFHLARLALARGQREQVRTLTDPLLARQDLDRSSWNDLDLLRMAAAKDFDDFLAHSEHRVTSTWSGWSSSDICDSESCQKNFDPAAQATLDRLPLAYLLRAAHDQRLTEEDRGTLANEAWKRGYLLKDDKRDEDAARLLGSMHHVGTTEIDSYLSAPAAERRFAETLALMRWDNGPRWCGGMAAVFTDANTWMEPMQGTPPDINTTTQTFSSGPFVPAFLPPADAEQARRELIALDKTPAFATYVGREVLAYARAHPDDPRVPEALARAVSASRYDCGDEGTGAVSKAAFLLLHHKYPNSPWTKKTKYWFGGSER